MIPLIVIDIVEIEHTVTYNNKVYDQLCFENIMETDKLNLEYDLLLHKTKLSSNIMERENNNNNTIVRSTDHIHFVICNSCYWCASYFSIDNLESASQVVGCHVCNSHDTELIPISTNESFRIAYNVTRGMEMEFYRTNDVIDKQYATKQHQVPMYL